MQTVLQTTWGVPIALYLFLGGLAAGTMVVSGLIYLKKGEEFIRTVRFGAWAGVVCLAAGLLCLLMEVSEPLRALQLWSAFTNSSSWMAIGAWLLFCGMAAFGIYALGSVIAPWRRIMRPWSYLVIALGVCIAVYTGILLGVLKAHPLWNSALLPCLFTVSALDTGVALVAIFMAFGEKAEECAKVQHVLERVVFVLVIAEMVVLAGYLVLVGTGSTVGANSVSILVGGKLAVPFWALFVVIGLVAPLALAILTLKRQKAAKGAAETPAKPAVLLPVLGAACALVGGLALRFLVLAAGIPVWM